MKKTSETPENLSPEQTFNSNYTAKPKPRIITQELIEQDGPPEKIDYGTMNLDDAIESGYTDEEGHAVSMAKHDVEGSPTGAFTDIGAGRSSVVKKHH
ncbi:hypothetical protein AZI86_08115 [Bdellovibrio bacteriovorus]|uniref:Uncharacterized protein n=1 Tax=Bdellovibrio bacteriovorus TaxID=959 RepID=A0A150WRM8_BDEBC|nr:hypothetical protein [Bdellovibrio bacteriovorus]KYG66977.1 hypothetical protein AZI86_08115 [Bdellovibrio bacteriovorus]